MPIGSHIFFHQNRGENTSKGVIFCQIVKNSLLSLFLFEQNYEYIKAPEHADHIFKGHTNNLL